MPRLSVEQAKDWQTEIRDLIKHENDLVNQRLGWLIQIQGLLFAALAFAWEKAPWPLTALLSFLGIATAISLSSILLIYSPAVREMRQWWVDHRPDGAIEGPDIIGKWLPSSGIARYLRPWRALPAIFIVAWIGVLALSIYYKKPSGSDRAQPVISGTTSPSH